jgi:hypothetical protein
MTNNEKMALINFLSPGSDKTQTHPTLGCLHLNMEVDSGAREQYIDYISKAIRETYVDSNYLSTVMEREGFDGVAKLFKERFENNKDFGVRTGDFGEIVGHTVLMDIFGYSIPIYKIRYKTNWNKAAFGVDIIAFRLDENDPSNDAVVFGEAKASTQKDYGVEKVFEEIEQLVENEQSEAQQKMRNAVRFVSERLFELKQYDLEKRIYRFLDSYTKPHYIEAFYPFLIRDKHTWSDDVLQKIVIKKPEPNQITLCVFVIEDLDKVIDIAYEKATKLESHVAGP